MATRGNNKFSIPTFLLGDHHINIKRANHSIIPVELRAACLFLMLVRRTKRTVVEQPVI
jgi:hypothetical protein